MDYQELVLKTLKEKGIPMKSKEIAEFTGTDKADIDKAIKVLKKGDRISSPKVCYYGLK